MLAKAIIFGRRSAADLRAAIEGQYPSSGALPSGVVFARDAKGASHALLVIEGDQGADLDVYAGERTIVLAGPDGRADPILRALAGALGGFVRPALSSRWESVAQL